MYATQITKVVAVLVAAMACMGSAQAQTAMTMLRAESVTWTVAPALPKGFQSTTVYGDPMKAGDMVVQRIKLPAHALVPPHTHPFAETVTVISGTVGFGMGDKIDRSGQMLGPGGLYAHPANDPHYVWTGDEGAIVQIQYIGPGGVTYIDPADDPRKK